MATGNSCVELLTIGFVFSTNLSAATSALTAIADTALDENESATPQGNQVVPRAESSSSTHGVARNHALFRFDTSASISAGSLITSVEFTLNIYKAADPTPGNFDLRRMTVSWREGNSTWQLRDPATDLWGAFGGLEGTDFSRPASASLGNGGTDANPFSSTNGLVADVQGSLGNPASNFAWMLLSTAQATERSARRFFSRDYISDRLTSPVNYTSDPEPSVRALAALDAAGWAGWRLRRNR